MSIKGTASVSDDHAMAKMLKTTKFPSNFSSPVELSKLNVPVLSQWVEQRVAVILGFEDDIVQSTAINLFMPSALPDSPPPVVNPRRAQLDLAGFLGEKEAAEFAKELWSLMLDAQSSPMGIPKQLLEEKKQEMKAEKDRNQSENNIAPPYRPEANAANGRIRNPAMNRFVNEARQRAEAAREALGGSHEESSGARRQPVPPPPPGPVRVSPPHQSEQLHEREGSVQRDRDEFGRDVTRRNVKKKSKEEDQERVRNNQCSGRHDDNERGRDRNERDDYRQSRRYSRERHDDRRQRRRRSSSSERSSGSDSDSSSDDSRRNDRGRRRRRDYSSPSASPDRRGRGRDVNSSPSESHDRRDRDDRYYESDDDRRRYRDRHYRHRDGRRSSRDRYRREPDERERYHRRRSRSRSYDRSERRRSHHGRRHRDSRRRSDR